MPTSQKRGPAIARVTFRRHQAVVEKEFREGWSALAIYERHKAELSPTISYRQFLRYVSEWRPEKPKPRKATPRVESTPPAAMPTMQRPTELDTRPRERKRIVFRTPTALAEGEAAPDDGSRLPAPLRPEPK